MSRDHVLHRVRTAIGRSAGQEPAPPPPLLIEVPELDLDGRLAQFASALEKLAGRACLAASPQEACSLVAGLIAGKRAVASNAPFLRECGITALEGVAAGFADPAAFRAACAAADVGITSAGYALADTGSLVLVASPEEARLVSLLPPVHIAVVPKQRLLSGLDELFLLVPDPAELSCSMVLITGPSRTADIEQILVRGVHGPGTIHVIFV
jgi:L-lactate utilization protein LutC